MIIMITKAKKKKSKAKKQSQLSVKTWTLTPPLLSPLLPSINCYEGGPF